VEIRFSTDVEYGINEHNYGTKPKIIWVYSILIAQAGYCSADGLTNLILNLAI
jgi:hypothetical protein